MVSAIIVAAGKSERMGGGVDKAFLSLGSRPVLAYSLRVMEQCTDVDEVILVVRKDQIIAANGLVQLFGCKKVAKVVAGGATRQASVSNGLAACGYESTIVCVHDGARPCVTPELISETIKSAKLKGSGVAATKVTDTVKTADKNQVAVQTIDREKLWTTQTPQTFKIAILRKALAKAEADNAKHTDEASALEALGEPAHLVQTPFHNIKITTPEDIKIASLLLGIQ
jgi:2-C-methyl-D-erythritol 4-phosphate cytidylyltransferase